MQQIIPFDISIKISKSKLTTKLDGKNEQKLFSEIPYIKESLDSYFPTPESGYLAFIQFKKKLIGMDQKVEYKKVENSEIIFMKLLAGKPTKESGDMKIVSQADGKLLYNVKKGEVALHNFFVYIKLNKYENQKDIKFVGSAYLLVKGIQTIRGELEILLRDAVYSKKAQIEIKAALKPKEIKEFKQSINQIEVTGKFKKEDKFISLDNPIKRQKLKMGFYLKGKGAFDFYNEKNIDKIFIGKPEVKAHLKIGESRRVATIDTDDMTLLMKSDIIHSSEKDYSFQDFRNKCLEHDFGLNQPIRRIK